MSQEATPLNIQPGFVLGADPGDVPGRIIAGNHICFVNARAEKMPGWEKGIDDDTITGLARGAFSWTTLAGNEINNTGTATKLYAIGDMIVDITPLRDSGTLANDPFSVTDTLTTVTVTDVAHGLTVGDTVIFSGASAGGGITIVGPYLVVSVIGIDSYTITHSAPATSTDATTGGAAVAYEYEINVGSADTAFGTGWGAGTYGEGTYGTPRDISDAVLEDLRFWSFGRYGNILACSYSGGSIFSWDEPNNDDRAVILSGAPEIVRYMFITAERFIIALGADGASTISGGPMCIKWPDVDDPTDWVPSSSNTANERSLQNGNKMMAGCVWNQASFLWSDTHFFIMQFQGLTGEIYETRPIASGCGLLAQGAFAVTPLGIVWLGIDDAYLYNGTLQTIPRFEEVREHVFGGQHTETDATGGHRHINMEQASKVWAEYIPRRGGEVIFGLVFGDDTEPKHYVKVNLKAANWDAGTFSAAEADTTLGRTAGSAQTGPTGDVIMYGTDSYVYAHEVTRNADGAAMESYIQVAPDALSDGNTDMDIAGFVPIFNRRVGDLTLDIEVKDRLDSDEVIDSDSVTIADTDSLVDLDLGGRYAGWTITSFVVDGDFSFGTCMVETGPAGSQR